MAPPGMGTRSSKVGSVIDELDVTVCECGQPLDTHPPLPKPPPLSSWMGQKNTDDKYRARPPAPRKPLPRV